MQHIGPVLEAQQAAGLIDRMLRDVVKGKAIYQIIETAVDSDLVGMVSMLWQPAEQAVVAGMIVRPAYQNQGVCKWAQMTAMQLITDTFPARLCTVYIGADNGPASTSYRHMGFVPVENNSTHPVNKTLVRWDYSLTDRHICLQENSST